MVGGEADREPRPEPDGEPDVQVALEGLHPEHGASRADPGRGVVGGHRGRDVGRVGSRRLVSGRRVLGRGRRLREQRRRGRRLHVAPLALRGSSGLLLVAADAPLVGDLRGEDELRHLARTVAALARGSAREMRHVIDGDGAVVARLPHDGGRRRRQREQHDVVELVSRDRAEPRIAGDDRAEHRLAGYDRRDALVGRSRRASDESRGKERGEDSGASQATYILRIRSECGAAPQPLAVAGASGETV